MTCSDALDLQKQAEASKLDSVTESEETKQVKSAATAGSIPYIHLTKKGDEQPTNTNVKNFIY